MKNTSIGIPRRTRLAVAIAAACSPLALMAQPLQQVPLYGNADMTPYSTNNVEIGAAYSNDDSFKFGEWTGLRKKGGYVLGGFNFDQINSVSGNYLSASGWNLGLPSRQLEGAIGQQGRWGLNANYEQLTRYVSDSTRSPYDNPGAYAQVSAAAGTLPCSGNLSAAYAPCAHSADVTTDRKIYGIGGNVFLIPGVELIADFNQTKREGTFLAGYQNAGTGAFNPINDKTDQITLGARYSSDALQAELTWWHSKYSNDVIAAGLAGPGFTAAPFNAVAPATLSNNNKISLAPDNEFNQVSGTVAYSLAPTYQVVGTLSHSWGTQNSPYPLGSVLAYPGITQANAVSVSSMDGKTKQTLIDLTFTGRPMADLGLKANYRFDDRQNDSPQYRYYVDASNRYNLVPDYKDNRFLIEADYRLMKLTKLRGWYEFKKQEYDPAVQFLRADAKSNQVGAELSSRLNPMIGGSLKYVWDKRNGADYTSRSLNTDGTYPPSTNGGQAVQFNDVVNLRQYWVSNYNQDTLKGTVSIAPSDIASVQFVADWRKRDYTGPSCGTSAYDTTITPTVAPTCVGLNKSDRTAYTLDGQLMPMDGVALFAFYSFSQLKQDQTGSINTTGALANLWRSDTKNKDNTIGLGASYKPASLPLSGGMQYVWTKGNESWSQVGVGGAAATNLPDNDYKQQSVQLWAGWKFNKDVTLRANYWWQKMDSVDWASNYVQPWSVGSSLWLSGQQSPNYTVNVFAVSANVRF